MIIIIITITIIVIIIVIIIIIKIIIKIIIIIIIIIISKIISCINIFEYIFIFEENWPVFFSCLCAKISSLYLEMFCRGIFRTLLNIYARDKSYFCKALHSRCLICCNTNVFDLKVH